MRRVACLAAVNSDGGVLVEEWAAFIDMAFQAGLFVLQAGIDHVRATAHLPNRCICTVRIVAIRTGHEPFVDSMLKRLGELRANIVMAAIANFRLAFRQETPVGLGLVNRMAGGADDICLGMIAAPYVRPADIFRMAAQTGIQRLGRSQFGKRHDTLLAALRIYVVLARPVATLTSSILDCGFGVHSRLIVRIPEKLQSDVWVAGPASIAPRISRVGAFSRIGGRLRGQRKRGAKNED